MMTGFRKLLLSYPKILLAVFAFLGVGYYLCLPSPLFKTPLSVVLEDQQGVLLGARIAGDGQWRFPPPDSIPEKFAEAIVLFEDRRFYRHPGVDLLSLLRALRQNLRSGRIVSGGSTLSMQVIRMARGNRRRTVGEKLIEMVMATRLDLGYRKSEILSLYASHAPFGGNVVGLEAATWRYFGKQPHLLSWSEAATLAVLPNSPALIHPDRNRELLLAKRNLLLDKLYGHRKMDSLTWSLAKEEPLPERRHPLPTLAPHLLDRMWISTRNNSRESPGPRFRTTLDAGLQQRAAQVLSHHQKLLSYNEINNMAALIADVESGAVLAYVGNVQGAGAAHHEQVDVVKANRSTGSILKPLLYAAMIHEGLLLPESIVPDVPFQLGGYRPENFHQKYDGVVSARRALARSLNVPFVNLLQEYGVEKFHYRLKSLGLSGISRPPDHYGLSLILGGGECSLWDITGAYASMARTLRHFYPYDGQYDPGDVRQIHFLAGEGPADDHAATLANEPSVLSASAIWYTFEAMRQVERPDQEGDWRRFDSSRNIAWKTGTSFGFRDAWAVGLTSQYVVGVWAGNADGEGRPGLVGIKAAGPALFDLFDLLPGSEWFEPPYDEMRRVAVCRKSGFRALPICPADSVWIAASGLQSTACPYHELVHLDGFGQFRVNANCEPVNRIQTKAWFVLPPLEAYYYQFVQPQYQNPPPVREDCLVAADPANRSMQLIYPKYPTRIFVPKDLDGSLSRTVFSVAHVVPETIIHWHLDEQYLGQTQTFHNMELNPPAGKHRLVLVDEHGRRLEQVFEIIPKS